MRFAHSCLHRSRLTRHRLLTMLAVWGLTAIFAPRGDAAAGDQTGEQIYKKQCAECHGAGGEGSEDYPRALTGDRTIAQLSRLIAKTMPEDDPGTCVGEDADKVAKYVHETFYSSVAQARNKPPRIELSRLTVRQYRNVIADLIGGFREQGGWDERRGLRGQYYKSRQYRDGDRVLDRLDPEIRFDFGTSGPDPEKFEPNEFSIRWEGSVLAPETGEYEFIVRTEHAARLWVNDNNRPLIDALVKSGNDTEYHGSIVLLGGRVYPLRLEFTKAKQGVDDSKKRKGKPPAIKASIGLEWKLPHRPAETIPQHCLSPRMVPESFVVTSAFPPDDRSVGYERGTSVSKAWDQATTTAAIEVAGFVSTHLRQLAGTREEDADREKKLREFSLRFVEHAFRRPLTDEQKQRYVDHQFTNSKDLQTAVKRVVLLTLKSPRFLYREVDGKSDAYDVAARISFGLWDSLPDRALLDAAASGQLGTRDQVVRQAERMVSDLRTRAKIREFFFHWLKVDQIPDLAKDPEQFPGFDAQIASDLRTSLDLFLDDVVWGPASDFRTLLLSDFLFVNGRLARYYDVELLPDAPFQRMTLYPGERAGVLTHPYLMAAFAYTATTSPIHRGVFISRSVLGRSLRPPPEAVAPLAPDLHAGLSTRERVALQTSPSACMTCHGRLNPLGFGLENFDAVGRFRSDEKGRPIDATGVYETPSGGSVPFSGARQLATLLADSDETHKAFVEELFHNVVKQPIRAFGPRELPNLQRSFAENGFNIRKLIVEIMASTALPPPKSKP